MTNTDSDVTAELRRLFHNQHAPAFFHARGIDDNSEVGLDAQQLVAAASTFKIAVALEIARQAAEGKLEWGEPVRVRPKDRTPGLAMGLCAMVDEAELSLRDLAYLMMSVSDNTPTDLIMGGFGLDAINATVNSLGLQETRILGDCAYLVNCLISDMGVGSLDDLEAAAMRGEINPRQMRQTRILQSGQTTSHTSGNDSTLTAHMARRSRASGGLRRGAAPHVAAGMGRSNRVGIPPSVKMSAKNGTLDGIVNEAGVIELSGGNRCAVAIYTRPEAFGVRLPDLFRTMGRAAEPAVTFLDRA